MVYPIIQCILIVHACVHLCVVNDYQCVYVDVHMCIHVIIYTLYTYMNSVCT